MKVGQRVWKDAIVFTDDPFSIGDLGNVCVKLLQFIKVSLKVRCYLYPSMGTNLMNIALIPMDDTKKEIYCLCLFSISKSTSPKMVTSGGR